MLNLMKKNAAPATKTAIQMSPAQKKTTTVANVAGKVKTGAFGVATGAGIAGTMMLQNEKSIRNRKAREAYHKRVEQVCTVAVGAAVVGAGAAIIQGIFDPIVDVSMLEIEPAAYVELNDKGSAIQEAAQNSNAAKPVEDEDGAEAVSEQNAEQPAEKVVAEIVQTEQPASAPKAEKPIVEATATEVPVASTSATPADPAPVAPQAEQPAAPAPKDATTASAPAAPKAEQPVDPTPAVQTNNQGKQQPKNNGQGANNNSKSNNKNANAAK